MAYKRGSIMKRIRRKQESTPPFCFSPSSNSSFTSSVLGSYSWAMVSLLLTKSGVQPSTAPLCTCWHRAGSTSGDSGRDSMLRVKHEWKRQNLSSIKHQLRIENITTLRVLMELFKDHIYNSLKTICQFGFLSFQNASIREILAAH